ncbi:MAG TPA: MFS transporter [Steroidobacteraceae bacterium]|nr:MFS transporter [Steroidobacteraceae bacterium]
MQNAWSPFRHRAFAMLWGAALLSNVGSWMHDVAAGWLMTTLAPTPLMVALVQSATTLPVFLLSLPAGTLADRLDRRRLLITVQTAMLLLAGTLGGLVLHGGVTPQLLLAVTFALGICTAVMSPTWQAILPKLVPREDFPPAVALHSVGINISRAIGPALGGVIIVSFGIAWPFFFNSFSFLAVIAALLWWRPAPDAPRQQPIESFGSSMLIGLQQARSNRALRATLLRSSLFFTFGSAYWALLPLIARVQLAGTARLFGVLVGCIGMGAVGGALLLPRLRVRYGADGVLLGGTMGTALAMVGYALVPVPALGMVASLVAGASWIASLSTLNIAAQLAVPDWVRARGMALFSAVLYGCLALGSIAWGHIAGVAGIEAALLLAAGGAVAAWFVGPRLTQA